ncbi:MAG: NlpC/P60 family protein [Kocuria sp.]|uniref:NlpC/P60 family protein n=1 Tax=Kocuria salsicia TaxID=664639 RepID=A0ABV3KBV4_9MICC|nr:MULTISPECIES: NlpC/P60 family protein [Kocuria]MBS6030443.1 C40 family peptidase [Kocuria rhizophila]MDO4257625.1 NlpC/P60 family protein [Kocuria sp.]
MSFVKHSTARHRAETSSHVVRNSTVAAVAAGAVVAGFASPAQAAGEVVDLGTTSYSVTSYTTQSSGMLASSSGVSTQSNHSASGVVGTAYEGIGGAYVWGGTGFKAWDCSGFVQWVYAQNGINLPRTTWAQFAASTPTSNPQPGDLVSQNGGSHVGIYIGNGQMISALNPSQGTQVHAVNAMQVDGYYSVR